MFIPTNLICSPMCFIRPVIVEIPHFGSMRGQERELIILRSENGESWKEHLYDCKTDDLIQLLAGMDEGSLAFRPLLLQMISGSSTRRLFFIFNFARRAGQSRGAGEEENLPHHHQGLSAILCRCVTNPPGDQSDGPGGRNPLQPERPVGSGFLPRGGANQEDQSWAAGERKDAHIYVKKKKKKKFKSKN